MAGELSRQDQYDESVGYAYGYTLTPVAMGKRCIELFPAYADTINHGLQRWTERNADALAEVQAQWRAYVERDHKVARLPAKAYEQKVVEATAEALRDGFATLGGEHSIPAQQHCQNYVSVTLRSTKLYLETHLMTELENFRSCRREGLCPNVSEPVKRGGLGWQPQRCLAPEC